MELKVIVILQIYLRGQDCVGSEDWEVDSVREFEQSS